MNRFVKMILLSNLVTIVITIAGVSLALHTNWGAATTPTATATAGGRFLQVDNPEVEEEPCCDCDTGEPIVEAPLPAFCFSASTSRVRVLVVEGETISIPMKELTLGQHVYVGNGKYEKIYSFGHYKITTEVGTTNDNNNNSGFLRISTTSSEHFMDLTRNHMVWRNNNKSSSFVAASELKIGDRLLFDDENNDERSTITSIKSIPIPKDGYMAPFTPSGKIVVNGIMASTFVDLFSSDNKKLLLLPKLLSSQWIAHAFEFPHRTMALLFGCSNETYDEDGISNWVSVPLQFSQYWITSLSSSSSMLLFHVPFFAIFVILLSIFTITEQLMNYHFLPLVVFMIGFYYYSPNKKKSCFNGSK